MSKKTKNIGQLDLFDASGEALFPVEEVQIVQITQETNTKLQTNLNQDPDFMYIPAEIDSDFYPEELFLGNEDLPDTIPTFEETPVYTEIDISEDKGIDEDISKLIDFLNHEDNGERTEKDLNINNENGKIEKLLDLLNNEELYTTCSIDQERQTLVDKVTNRSLALNVIFDEEEEFWKITILERLDNRDIEDNEAVSIEPIDQKNTYNTIDEVVFYTELPPDFPLVFNEFGTIDNNITRKSFSIYEIVDFYLHILDKDRGFEQYEMYIPKFQEYLNKLGTYDIEKLRSFKENIDNNLYSGTNKSLFNIDGSMDFIGMSLFYGIKETMDDFDSSIKFLASGEEIELNTKKYMDPFIISIGKHQELNKIVEQKGKICELFDAIQDYFDEDDIREFGGKDKFKQYENMFSTILSCAKKKEEMGRGQERSDVAEFVDWCKSKVHEDIGESIRIILGNIDSEILKIKYLTAMFASYIHPTNKDNKSKNLTYILKKGIIRDYLFNTIRSNPYPGDERSKRLIKIKENEGFAEIVQMLKEDKDIKEVMEEFFHKIFPVKGFSVKENDESEREISHWRLLSKGLPVKALGYDIHTRKEQIEKRRREAEKEADDLPF